MARMKKVMAVVTHKTAWQNTETALSTTPGSACDMSWLRKTGTG
jgi:hypothetical protein